MRRALTVERTGQWPRDRASGTVTLGYDDRHRRRLRLTTDAGEAFMLDLPRATLLEAGDGLALEDGGWIEVRPAAEPLLEVRAPNSDLLARLAWHIGNRHLAAQIAQDRILLRDDHVIADMLRRLGASVRRIEASFTPERGAYDAVEQQHYHGHHHHDA